MDDRASSSETSAVLVRAVTAVAARSAPVGMTTKIVAIDGGGGAGKTTLAERISDALGGVQIVHTDDFASWDNPLGSWPRLITEVLEPLSRNEIARFEPTRWSPNDRLHDLDRDPG